MNTQHSAIYKGFTIAGIITFIIGIFSSGEVSINAFITGYSVLILGIMMLIFILVNTLPKNFNILISLLPFLLLLAVLSFMLYMLIYYNTPLVEERVSSGYYTFNTITMLLISLQLYIIYKNILPSITDDSVKISQLQIYMILLIGIITAISSRNVYIILKYFRTDGFETLQI